MILLNGSKSVLCWEMFPTNLKVFLEDQIQLHDDFLAMSLMVTGFTPSSVMQGVQHKIVV